MDVFTVISQRSSVRAYKDTVVEEDKLNKVLEGAKTLPFFKQPPGMEVYRY